MCSSSGDRGVDRQTDVPSDWLCWVKRYALCLFYSGIYLLYAMVIQPRQSILSDLPLRHMRTSIIHGTTWYYLLYILRRRHTHYLRAGGVTSTQHGPWWWKQVEPSACFWSFGRQRPLFCLKGIRRVVLSIQPVQPPKAVVVRRRSLWFSQPAKWLTFERVLAHETGTCRPVESHAIDTSALLLLYDRALRIHNDGAEISTEYKQIALLDTSVGRTNNEKRLSRKG